MTIGCYENISVCKPLIERDMIITKMHTRRIGWLTVFDFFCSFRFEFCSLKFSFYFLKLFQFGFC